MANEQKSRALLNERSIEVLDVEMNEVQRAQKVLKILEKIYPKVAVPLTHKNVFTLLISVLLSAQCTDVNVNNVTKHIYPKYNKPKHFIKLGRKK